MFIPTRLVEDVLIKIDKFIFPIDFVILDILEDKYVTTIVRRPFLTIEDTSIRVKDKAITFYVNVEVVTFGENGVTSSFYEGFGYFHVDVIEDDAKVDSQGEPSNEAKVVAQSSMEFHEQDWIISTVIEIMVEDLFFDESICELVENFDVFKEEECVKPLYTPCVE